MIKINTFTGIEFDLLNPSPKDIHIEDVAHALSMLCRFNGHCKEFYSVAEHSVHVSHEIGEELALVGLLHDAAEAYLGDVPTPLKIELAAFKHLEMKMEIAIAKRFGVQTFDLSCKELKRADNQLFADEWARLMNGPPPEGTMQPKERDIKFLTPEEANRLFLERFTELTR